ncbi:hypothetical protein IMG5_181580, partial [Ichthyophthirius multifiliis]
MYTYEMAPIFNFMEQKIFQFFQQNYLNWNNIDGILSPGNTQSLYYALECARHKYFPQSKKEGMKNLPKMSIFTSNTCINNVKKGCVYLGFGIESLVLLPTDKQGRIIPSEFEKALQKREKEKYFSLFLNLSMGTNLFGSIDYIEECTRIAQKYNVWVHLEGGMYQKGDFLKNIDSISIQIDKLFSVPQQCCIFLNKYENLLSEANALNSDYLFMKDKVTYDAQKYDSGDKTFQCARHIDILKFWIYLKKYGIKGIYQLLDNSIQTAKSRSQLCVFLIFFRSNFRIKKQGLGAYLYDSGDFYFGEWEDDRIQGEGILFFAFGGFIHGFFLNFMIHGPAFLKFSNGEIYEGNWNQGKLDGEAYNYFVDENIWFKGNYSQGKFTQLIQYGKGRPPSTILNQLSKINSLCQKHKTKNENLSIKVIDFKDGSQYLGMAKQKNPFGLGLLRRLDEKYDAGFAFNGIFQNIARLNLDDGQNMYIGQLQANGKFQGQGVYLNKKTKQWVFGIFENGQLIEVINQGQDEYPQNIISNIYYSHHINSGRFIEKQIENGLFYMPSGYNNNYKNFQQLKWDSFRIEKMRENTFSQNKKIQINVKRNSSAKLQQNNSILNIDQNTYSNRSPKSTLYQFYLSN